MKEFYEGKITELVEKIENPVILMKIYTVVKTHYEILREKEQRTNPLLLSKIGLQTSKTILCHYPTVSSNQ